MLQDPKGWRATEGLPDLEAGAPIEARRYICGLPSWRTCMIFVDARSFICSPSKVAPLYAAQVRLLLYMQPK